MRRLSARICAASNCWAQAYPRGCLNRLFSDRWPGSFNTTQPIESAADSVFHLVHAMTS